MGGQALPDDLLPGERVRFHADVAALRSGEVPGTAAELARHARTARDTPTAIRASIEAGDDAMVVGAPEEAARHYELPLELLARVGSQAGGSATAGRPTTEGEPTTAGGPVEIDDAEAGEHAIVGLVLKASDALVASGDPYRCVKLIADHLGALSPAADSSERVRLLVGLAAGTFLTDTDLDPLKITGEAMSLVPHFPPTPLRAQVFTVHAKATTLRLGGQNAASFATEAHEMALSLGMPRVAAEAAMTLAWIDNLTNEADTARSRLELIVARAHTDGDVNSELRGLHQIGGLNFGRGELPEALTVYQAAARRARESGRPWAPYGLDARAIAGITAYTIGDWDAALRAVDVSGESPPPMAESLLAAVKLSVMAGRRESGALELLEMTRPWWGRDGMTALLAGGAAVDIHGDRHEIDAAIAGHDDVIEKLQDLWQGSTIWVQIRLSALVLGQLANHASRAAQLELAELGATGARFVTAAADTWDHQPMTGPRPGRGPCVAGPRPRRTPPAALADQRRCSERGRASRRLAGERCSLRGVGPRLRAGPVTNPARRRPAGGRPRRRVTHSRRRRPG